MPPKKKPKLALHKALSSADQTALAACGKKTDITTALVTLQNAGILQTASSSREIRSTLTKANVSHSHANTPYGRVVQKIKLDIPNMEGHWEFCHPLAWLYYMSSLSGAFCEVMKKCVDDHGSCLTMIFYIDEVCPGNPFRHDKARKLQAIYWCILEWPCWLLKRSAMWPIFSVLRSKFADAIPGGLSGFVAKILEICFLGDNPCQPGVTITRESRDRFRVAFKFGGILADEDALKKLNGYKGAQGIKVCMDCFNLVASTDPDVLGDGIMGLNSTSLAHADKNDDDDIWCMADALADRARDHESIDDLEKEYGIKHLPDGLLLNKPLREIYKPITHYLRDPMHTLLSGGIGNVETACLIQALKEQAIPLTFLQEYASEVVLPKKFGTVCPSWLDHRRFSGDNNDSFACFASTLLTLLPIILAFLLDCVKDQPALGGALKAHIECFELLVIIVGFLTTSNENIVQHMPELQSLIEKHHTLFVSLYPGSAVKPKWHHLLHLPSLVIRLGKVLSCFVTERKHRSVKAAALHVFRHIEHTTLATVLNNMCQQVIEGHCLFQRQFLVSPKRFDLLSDYHLNRSTSAVLDCGLISKGDVIYSVGGVITRVMCFWQSDQDQMNVQCSICEKVDTFIFKDSNVITFLPIGSIIDAMAYRPLEDCSIRVIFPFAARFEPPH